MQNESIKLEHMNPIHSKLHIIRPQRQSDNTRSLSKDYKPKKKAYHINTKPRDIPANLNMKQ